MFDLCEIVHLWEYFQIWLRSSNIRNKMLSFAFVLWSMSPAVLQNLGYVLIWTSKTLIPTPRPKNVTRNSPSPLQPHPLLLFILYHTFIVSGFWTEEKEKRSKRLFSQ